MNTRAYVVALLLSLFPIELPDGSSCELGPWPVPTVRCAWLLPGVDETSQVLARDVPVDREALA